MSLIRPLCVRPLPETEDTTLAIDRLSLFPRNHRRVCSASCNTSSPKQPTSSALAYLSSPSVSSSSPVSPQMELRRPSQLSSSSISQGSLAADCARCPSKCAASAHASTLAHSLRSKILEGAKAHVIVLLDQQPVRVRRRRHRVLPDGQQIRAAEYQSQRSFRRVASGCVVHLCLYKELCRGGHRMSRTTARPCKGSNAKLIARLQHKSLTVARARALKNPRSTRDKTIHSKQTSMPLRQRARPRVLRGAAQLPPASVPS